MADLIAIEPALAAVFPLTTSFHLGGQIRAYTETRLAIGIVIPLNELASMTVALTPVGVGSISMGLLALIYP